jgi:hypothetical protein
VKSEFFAGFIQKTVKVDPNAIIRYENHSRRFQRTPGGKPAKKTARGNRPHMQAGRPLGPPIRPLLQMSVLYRLRVYAVLLSQFDPRAQD